jgi:hypothetical protein
MIRARVELAAAVLFAALCVLTVLVPQWIEAVFRVDVDGGSGAAEWSIVVTLGILAAIAAAIGHRDLVRSDTRRANGSSTASSQPTAR